MGALGWQRRRNRGAYFAGGYSFTPAESALMLPQSSIGISQTGVSQTGGLVTSWASYLGGLSCTMAQASAPAQPAYAATGGAGGLPLITLDGVDDVIEGPISKGSTWLDHEMGVVGARIALGAVSDAWMCIHQAGGFVAGLRDQSATALHFTTASTTAIGTSDPDAVTSYWHGSAIAGEVIVRRNGAVEGTTLAGLLSTGDPLTSALGGRVAASQYSNFECQAWVQSVRLTPVQRDYLRQLLTFWTQVPC